MRLNKLLAERVGLARRKCDAAIQAGEVAVDGVVVTSPGTSVDPEHAQVTFRGERVALVPPDIHLLFHKPLDVLVTWSDPQGRRTVKDYVPAGMPRLFAVGRLDSDTTGLLLLTNDGALAHRLAHPRYEVPKVYRITLAYPPTEAQLDELRAGVDLGEDERSRPAIARVTGQRGGATTVELVIAEGKKRQVRRMCKTVGLYLTALCRVAFGPLTLGSLPEGKTRPLTAAELTALRRAVAGPPDNSGTFGDGSGVKEDAGRGR
jgi:23S rRNA pseudouridine2605 synthase